MLQRIYTLWLGTMLSKGWTWILLQVYSELKWLVGMLVMRVAKVNYGIDGSAYEELPMVNCKISANLNVY